ncbi:hypothetical protein FRC12_022288 [Ceratobasidium sp. 428]|nr:hypothetical protein FRC12_022288 [Ceratobasidium sp. 428]
MSQSDTEADLPVNCRDSPDAENQYLEEEFYVHELGRPFGRVLSSFEFRINGTATAVRSDLVLEDGSSDLEVIGIIGTIYNKEGLFGQCAWFGNHDLDWFWVRIKGICSLRACEDARFRGGQKCLWMRTLLGEYALLLPHDSYQDLYEETIAGLGALDSKVTMWPGCGLRPSWWDDLWEDDWPFKKQIGGMLPLWPFESSPNDPNRAQISTNLSYIATPWSIRPDSGAVATRSLEHGLKRKPSVTAKQKRSSGSEQNTSKATSSRPEKKRKAGGGGGR